MADNLFDTTDPAGNRVRLTMTCYYGHIAIEHPDLQDIDDIEQSVRLPDIITEDSIDDNRMVYYRTYQRSLLRRMIKVVVEHEEVVTAYRVKRIKQGETAIWRR